MFQSITIQLWDEYSTQGCSLTRSLGDSIAHSLGVIALPEIHQHNLIPDDKVFIVASDGVTEYIDEKTCVDIVCQYSDASAAAKALVKEASKYWINKNDYMDDITAIVIFHNSNHASEHEENHNADAKDNSLINPAVKHEDKNVNKDDDDLQLNCSAQSWTIIAGATSGFLGGLCGIRGPPIILYFLHAPVVFTTESQRTTSVCITFTNVTMRVVYYIINTLLFDQDHGFKSRDWGLYLSIIVCSNLGVLVGSELFEYMKDSKKVIKGILTIFLLLCGVSLILSSFTGKS